MPFTIAHAAAALLFRRTRLIASGVVVGCFAPDFEYFMRLAPKGSFGHTLPGLFAFDIPLGLLVFWLFHKYAKEPLWAWLPKRVRRKVKLGPNTPPFKSLVQTVLLSISVFVGAATHIFWDSFTHPSFWPYHHLDFLRHTVRLPIAGSLQYYKLLQHASTVIGMMALFAWFVLQPVCSPIDPRSVGKTRVNERTVFVLVSTVAFVGGVVRAFLGVGVPHGSHRIETFVGEAVITAMSLFWLELLVFGFLRQKTSSKMQTT